MWLQSSDGRLLGTCMKTGADGISYVAVTCVPTSPDALHIAKWTLRSASPQPRLPGTAEPQTKFAKHGDSIILEQDWFVLSSKRAARIRGTHETPSGPALRKIADPFDRLGPRDEPLASDKWELHLRIAAREGNSMGGRDVLHRAQRKLLDSQTRRHTRHADFSRELRQASACCTHRVPCTCG